jgi:iron complex transport system substrate-binding protein
MGTRLTLLKKPMALLAALTIAVCMLAGCASGNNSASSEASSSGTRTVVDQVGRTVEIPTNVDKIVPLGNTPRMITYLGLADKAVGIGGMNRDQITPITAYAYSNKELWADLPIVGTDAAGATDYYPEQIISLKPDVILCSYTAELADEIQGKTGIPVISVSMGSLYQEDYKEALRILGDACGVKDRAEEVIAFIDDSLNDLNSRTANIPNANKPSVLGAAATFKGKHGIEGVYVNYPVFTSIHARDVADSANITKGSSAFTVDKEQILGWNPDMIFLDAGNIDLVREDVQKNPEFYKQLSAFNAGNIYKYPNSTSYYSNVEIPIVNSYYVGSLLYPEQFKDIDFEKKAAEVFEFFLGDADYLKKLESGGYGYGKVEF